MNKKIPSILLAFFILALVLRFLYFPNNIYFGFDQARDAFAVNEILNGHLKLIGPPTTFEGLRHGVLYYYLYTPFYLLGKGNPEIAAAFLRVLNSLGVVLIFLVATLIFNKYVGLISSILFAVSFEQTQFALYFNHPSFAVISILITILGLSLLIFRKKEFGLVIALFGLGLSIQFEFILTYLIAPFTISLLVFRKSLYKLNLKTFILGVISFLLLISTFIIAEIKYNFRTTLFLKQLIFEGTSKSLYKIASTYLFEMGQLIKFNLVAFPSLILITGIALLFLFIILLLTNAKKQMLFLGIWFFSGLIIYFISGGEDLNVDVIQYHPNVGLSLSLIVFTSYLIYLFGKESHFLLSIILILLISFGNFSLIQKINPFGSMPEINAQSFMLLSDEKRVLDFIYQDTKKQGFAVKAITLPFYINTTWSYLFEWYGKQRYNYLPIWGGKNASGYPGNIQVEDAQDKLPQNRYLIIEPNRGIPQHLINDYLREESYFTNLLEQKKIGSFIVQKRVKK